MVTGERDIVTPKAGPCSHPQSETRDTWSPRECWAPSLACCVSLGKSPHLYEPWFFSSKNSPYHTHLKGLLWDIKEMMAFKYMMTS